MSFRKKQNSKKYFFNLFFKILFSFILLLLSNVNSYSKTIQTNFSQRLWQGITENDIELLKKISQEIKNKNYDQAIFFAQEIKKNYNNLESQKKNPSLADALIDLILWNKYSSKNNLREINFSDISNFVLDNPYFPNINQIKRNVEEIAVIRNIPYDVSEQYFKINPAQTTESKIYLVESKISSISTSKNTESQKDIERRSIRNQIAKIWIKENFTPEEEKNFFNKYQNLLTEEEHFKRIERLLWEGRNDEAQLLLNLVNEDYKKLFNAILEIEKSPKYIDKIILNVPRKLRSNEVLTYRRIIWNKARNNVEDLIELMVDLPNDSKFPEKWWSLRKLYGREMLKQKKYKIAYRLLSYHNLPTNSPDFWEAEWTSGWIALRFLDKPKEAYNHFDKLYKNVSQPVTLSRAVYWLGMTSEQMNDKERAIEWYKMGTKYPIFFYGQLAIHKHRLLDPIGAQEDIILPKNPDISQRDIEKSSESRALQIAYLLAITGDKDNASKIFEWAVNNSATDGQIAVIMKLINEIGDKQLDVKISRVAAKKNVFFIKEKFQIVNEVINDQNAPLIHAIIKQESGFAPSAVSKVGAIGYMQLMPDTAKLVAKELGISYDRTKLATDIRYNIRLGSYYIMKLVNQFEGSEMLAIASYNAGPNATLRWINEFYDPRKEKNFDKVVDWIELISYSETRNYVQRIIENMIVYKYLMSRSNYDNVK
jgi:soluble lytic murein transglycosylase